MKEKYIPNQADLLLAEESLTPEQKMQSEIHEEAYNLGFEKNKSEKFDINKILFCELRNSEELWLHIRDLKDMPLDKKLYLLKDGLRGLADYFDNDLLNLKDVKIISATSWIVKETPRFLEKLGFTVDNNAESFKNSKIIYHSRMIKNGYRDGSKEMEPGYAYISREHFLERYGSPMNIDVSSYEKSIQ